MFSFVKTPSSARLMSYFSGLPQTWPDGHLYPPELNLAQI